ncbi:MAG: sigma-54 interaction domain-containing protein, partial [Cryomorphaceae bacterium]
DSTEYVMGQGPAAQHLNQHIEMVAPTPMSVVIAGETGTGKEFAARRIHELSDRSSGPFIAIDCGALPKDIAGSEFFGHEQGAFTGAVKSTEGKFKLAHGGTLFLDEVGNLTYDIQLKLLRVLQERKFSRIGGNVEIEVDIRILAATNDDLKNAVKNGPFREDLYYRLNEFSLEMAPLRSRPEDLKEFTTRFIENSNALLNKKVEGLSEEVHDKFSSYSWPGNLRELRNVIKRAVLLSKGPLIELSALPEEIAYGESMQDEGHSPVQGDSLKGAAEVAEREKIVKILSRTGNNKSKAARLLNIDRKTLYNKLKNYGI